MSQLGKPPSSLGPIIPVAASGETQWLTSLADTTSVLISNLKPLLGGGGLVSPAASQARHAKNNETPLSTSPPSYILASSVRVDSDEND